MTLWPIQVVVSSAERVPQVIEKSCRKPCEACQKVYPAVRGMCYIPSCGNGDRKGAMARSSIESLVSQQVEVWELRRRSLARRQTRRRQGPCVTVSREFGTLGAAIAREVANRLGFEFYNTELITHIAKTKKVREALLESVDERGRDMISEWIAEQFGTQETVSTFLQHLRGVIMTIAHHGKAVLVGRGAQFMLSPSSTLRVRLFARVEDRVASVMERHGVSKEEARDMVLESDRTRAEFYKRYFGKRWDDPGHYDLLINTAHVDFQGAIDLIVTGAKAKLRYE